MARVLRNKRAGSDPGGRGADRKRRGKQSETDRRDQHGDGLTASVGIHDRVWNRLSIQDKQSGVKHDHVDPGERSGAAGNQRGDIQPGMGADGHGRRERGADAGAEHWRHAQGARRESDGADGEIPGPRRRDLAVVIEV